MFEVRLADLFQCKDYKVSPNLISSDICRMIYLLNLY